MALIKNMGGKVSKKYDLGVGELAPPGTMPIRPGLTFFDWTWVFDCHGEGACRRDTPNCRSMCCEAAERVCVRLRRCAEGQGGLRNAEEHAQLQAQEGRQAGAVHHG
eukprot:COSAG02_NODE_3629_length_6450_cov_3.065816_4_plen_107_part_01